MQNQNLYCCIWGRMGGGWGETKSKEPASYVEAGSSIRKMRSGLLDFVGDVDGHCEGQLARLDRHRRFHRRSAAALAVIYGVG